MVYKPLQHPDMQAFVELWQRLARENGLPGIYFVGQAFIEDCKSVLSLGLDAVNTNRLLDCVRLGRSLPRKVWGRIQVDWLRYPRIFDYGRASAWVVGEQEKDLRYIPSIFSGWDHTPRSGAEGIVLDHGTPEKFGVHVARVLDIVAEKPAEQRIVFLKSWNEWAEGNYMEPDLKYGNRFLETLKTALES